VALLPARTVGGELRRGSGAVDVCHLVTLLRRQRPRGGVGAQAADNDGTRSSAINSVRLNPNLPASEVAAPLTTHVNGTLAAIDTVAQGDFDQHYDLAHQGFDHSFMMGDMMALAIARQFPDRFAMQR
jgi:hypothetical protein